MTYLWTDTEWSFPKIESVYKAIEQIAIEELKLDPYPSQLEIITSEQMVDAYASIGMPIFYHHWSFGKHFAGQWKMYQGGMMGLAYEIVINSNPCIAYLMEENTMTMQALTIAHACVSCDTEYLTPTGWRRIDQYDGSVVGQYHEDGRVTFIQPEAYIKRDQDNFIHVNSEKVSQAITDDHTVITVNQHGTLNKISGKELVDRQANKTRGFDGKFITAFEIDHENSLDLSDNEIRLQIAIKADGSIINPDVDKSHHAALPHYRIRFHLKKERKISRLKEILTSLNIKYAESPSYDGRVFIVFNYKKINKRYKTEWYRASLAQLHLIGEEICHWDGSTCSPNPSFSSAYKEDVDYIQYVWTSTKHHAHMNWSNRAYRVTKSDNKLVSLSKSGRDGRKSSLPFEYIPSEDRKAYCFTLPTGMFVIRHMDKISVTGNCMGHSHFFKNNAVFREWTDATSIVDYLMFARNYIEKCEIREGRRAVETFLDSCHALMNYGINRYKRPVKLSAVKERERIEARQAYQQSQVNELFTQLTNDPIEGEKKFPAAPEENILLFCEKFAPELPEWKREILRIVRMVAQYFYPQTQTQICNEGCATYTHYRIMNRLHEKGLMTDGAMIEFLKSHTSVVNQPGFDDPHYRRNPYAFGFAMMRDIERICHEPTDEDRRWFEFAGCGDEMTVLKDGWANYRDESFIRQFLSPKVIRDLRLFQLKDDRKEPTYEVMAIHNEQGYEAIREKLANECERFNSVPQIEVVKVDPKTRTLTLEYQPYQGRGLENVDKMLKHLEHIWGNSVNIYDNKGNHIAGPS